MDEIPDIVELLSRFTDLEIYNGDFLGLCPFNHGSSLSSIIWAYPGTQLCWCEEEQRNWDVYALARDLSLKGIKLIR